MKPPETRWARSGDLHIAYQVVGDGPVDLVMIPGFVSHVEVMWEWPPFARFLGRLGSFARLIVFDKRGTGLSDRHVVPATAEEQMDDVVAVLDAVGSERPVVFGTMDGASIAMLFAASHPERVSDLILYGTRARFLRTDDYPWGNTADEIAKMLEEFEAAWMGVGGGSISQIWVPRYDDGLLEWEARYSRASAGPGTVMALLRMYMQLDTRSVLPAIQARTLVLRRDRDPFNEPGHAQYIADHIPNAELAVVPGDSLPLHAGNADVVADEIERFVTGSEPMRDADRVLATVLFTDIVDSTQQSSKAGDRRWRELLDAHDSVVDREISRHRGRRIKFLGDGVLAIFDGPGRGVRCAASIRDAVARLGISIRAGVHTGELELRGDDVAGLTVVIAQRVSALASAGEIVVSRTVVDLLAGSDIDFADRGSRSLKGVPGRWRVFSATP